VPEDHAVLSFLELSLMPPKMCPQLLFTEQAVHKFQWRKNRGAEDWRRCRLAVTMPTGVLTSDVPFHVLE